MKGLLSLTLTVCIAFNALAQTRTIDVSDFSELSFSVPGELFLRQGPDVKVEVKCSDSIFEDLEFEMSGDRLTIKKEGRWNWRDSFRSSDLTVYVTMREVERLSLSGSGTITGENTINTDDIRVSVSGSGNIELDLDSRAVDLRISGSGDIEMEGTSDRIEARISGSGRVDAEEMQTKVFEASISGSGNCYTNVSEEINASISGSGSVYYTGNPDRVIANSSGSGKIRKR